MKCFGNTFQRLCWRLKREMRNNRKPIVLLFGNGYDSQILLVALNKLGKKIMIVHAVNCFGRLTKKTRNILHKFSQHNSLILRPKYDKKDDYKSFANGNSFCFEDLNMGFSPKDYFIITGFKLTENWLVRAFQNGVFEGLYSPLLRYCDNDVEELYQDMKDNEAIGDFMFQNLASDSPHNIIIT